jgi:NAD-dependent SIR2 family protein deacetylase
MTPLDQAASWVRRADALMVTAGAGMGVDSGLPDFRGTDGFWRAYPALGAARIDFASIASPRAFRNQPELAWGFYGHRLALYRATVPHAGFEILKLWASRMRHGGRVFTSNVDGHFQLAGFPEDHVYECHGSIHHLQCLRRCSGHIWPAGAFDPDVDTITCRLRNCLPRCEHCGGLARPNILMFGDGEWVSARSSEQSWRLERWLREVENVVVIEMGAGTAIPSVRHFGERLVRGGNGHLIRINPREPQVPSGDDVGLAMGALEGLRAIEERL